MPTIGVSVPVPAPYGDTIQSRRCAYGDAAAVGIPTHVTVLGPTEVAAGALPDISAHLARVAAQVPAFTLTLRGTATFRPVSPVVYLRVAEGAEGCRRLEDVVRTGPLARDIVFPYHPHVTVVHGGTEEVMDQAQAELADFAAQFPVDAVCLYVQEDGRWHSVERFPLAPVQAAAVPSTLV